MKQFVVALALALSSLTAANASLILCPSAQGNVSQGELASLSFTCGTLTFGNFEVANANSDAIGSIDVNGASYDSVTGTVSLNLNPNLGSSDNETLLFEVWGGVTQLDLAIGGTDAQVQETACSSPIPTSGPNAFICPTGTMLGRATDFSNDQNQPVFSKPFGTTSPIYIIKNIQTGAGRPAGVGQLSELDQSFHIAGDPVPEPVSLVLLGSGLLGLGLMRRRARRS